MALTEPEERVGMTTLAQRIRHQADLYEEHREAARIAKDRRDELIVQARDAEGASYVALARYAGLSKSRVIAILGTPLG